MYKHNINAYLSIHYPRLGDIEMRQEKCLPPNEAEGMPIT